MRKLWMIGAGIVSLSVAGALAQGDATQVAPGGDNVKHARHAEGPKPEMKELTLTGTVQKVEHKKKDGTVFTAFKLVTVDGIDVMLSKNPAAKNGAPAIDLESLVGSNVKIVGMGFEMDHNGKKMYHLNSITSAEKVGMPVAPAAATPAPAAAPAP